MKFDRILKSAHETRQFGKNFSKRLRAGDVVLLFGPVGAGKTTFVQGLARGLGCTSLVSSPTFVLVQKYEGKIPLYHVDLYRLKDREVKSLGLDDFIGGDSIMAVEWPERVKDFFPGGAVRMEFSIPTLETRRVTRRVRVEFPRLITKKKG